MNGAHFVVTDGMRLELNRIEWQRDELNQFLLSLSLLSSHVYFGVCMRQVFQGRIIMTLMSQRLFFLEEDEDYPQCIRIRMRQHIDRCTRSNPSQFNPRWRKGGLAEVDSCLKD